MVFLMGSASPTFMQTIDLRSEMKIARRRRCATVSHNEHRLREFGSLAVSNYSFAARRLGGQVIRAFSGKACPRT
ncbi:MAG: hypothetical protein R3D62_21235 [Xanthobacteraceae bacterium]